MSQQHMNPGEGGLGDQHTIYSEYNVPPKYDSYSDDTSGQKLTGKAHLVTMSSDQLLSLAKFSLILWTIVCIIIIISLFLVPRTNVLDNGLNTVDNPYATMAYIILISALVLFTVLTLIINILFYRRRT